MEEVWKDVPEFEGLYQVSNLGLVKSLGRYVDMGNFKSFRKERILKPDLNKGGYLVVTLQKEKISKRFQIHRLVASVFITNPDNLPQVNHKNEDKTDNRVENLEWCDPAYNCNYGERNKKISVNASGKHINRYDLSRRIGQYTTDGILVKEYPSANEVHRQLNYDTSSILKCCKGVPFYKTCHNFVWKFL